MQPIGSVLFAASLQGHLSAGATITVSPNWQMVIGTAFTAGRLRAGDSSPFALQLWLSAAPVRLFHREGMGYRFQFETFTLSFMLPTPSVGFAINSSGHLFSTALFGPTPEPGAVNLTYSVDVNLFRVGGSF